MALRWSAIPVSPDLMRGRLTPKGRSPYRSPAWLTPLTPTDPRREAARMGLSLGSKMNKRKATNGDSRRF